MMKVSFLPQSTLAANRRRLSAAVPLAGLVFLFANGTGAATLTPVVQQPAVQTVQPKAPAPQPMVQQSPQPLQPALQPQQNLQPVLQPTLQPQQQPQPANLQPTLQPSSQPMLRPTLQQQQPNTQPGSQPASPAPNQPQQGGLQQQPNQPGQPGQPNQTGGDRSPSARGGPQGNNPSNPQERKSEQGRENREKQQRPHVNAARIAQLAAADTARRAFRTEVFKEALSTLKENPKAADVEECKAGGGSLCVPSLAASARLHTNIIQPVEIGRRVAYLIGNNDYKSGIPSLETPQGDVEAIGKVLREKRGFDVKIVPNASKADIIRTLTLATKTTAQHQSVLIMYAGHGYQIAETGEGYWIPVDATPADPKGWVSNNDITKLLAAIPAKQIILISDSCFSGTLAKEQKLKIDPNADTPRQDLLAKRSVLALTSGGEEPVSDEGREGHSIFAATLIDAIQSINESTTVGRLFEKVRAEVSREFPQQPQLGAINSAGHAPGGDYLIDAR